ncbi:MAG: hypothetical protein QGF03_02595 [SAR324 cluster bacterium]|jgi:hypothetical protein|nr:hypothetical protein [SAR324 cluster bacterium]
MKNGRPRGGIKNVELQLIVKATSSRTNLDWGKTVKKLILNNIFIDHSVRFLTDFTINQFGVRLEIKLDEFKTKIIKWVAGLLLVQSGLVIVALFAMFCMFLTGSVNWDSHKNARVILELRANGS